VESTVHDGRTTDGGHSVMMDDDALEGKSEEKRQFGKGQTGG